MSAYFDFNATTPLSAAARDAWLRASEKHWHNPSSLYREAAGVKHRLEEARERLGELLGCEPERIVFTGGATESNNAILARLGEVLDKQKLVLSSGIEHPSVREPLRRTFGARVSFVRTTARGEFDAADFAEQLARGNTALVTAMAANNECGVTQPWREISRLCRERGVPFHTDAAQWIGKEPADGLGLCDYVTGCAHKFGGPKGTGFLVMRDEREALSFLRGGPQEEGRRAGTENYPGVAAMVAALEALEPHLTTVATAQSRFRDDFEAGLLVAFPALRVIGAGADRLWNTSMFVLPHGDNRKWLARLSQRGFAVSTGSACSAGHDGSSVVLAALGAGADEMSRVLRVSGGWETSAMVWRELAEALVQVGKEIPAEEASNG
jgi:cysteine desulfurase